MWIMYHLLLKQMPYFLTLKANQKFLSWDKVPSLPSSAVMGCSKDDSMIFLGMGSYIVVTLQNMLSVWYKVAVFKLLTKLFSRLKVTVMKSVVLTVFLIFIVKLLSSRILTACLFLVLVMCRISSGAWTEWTSSRLHSLLHVCMIVLFEQRTS